MESSVPSTFSRALPLPYLGALLGSAHCSAFGRCKNNTVSALFHPVKRGTGSIFQALVAPFARVKADVGHLMPSGHISMMYRLFPVVYSNFFAGYFEGLSICTINIYIYIFILYI